MRQANHPHYEELVCEFGFTRMKGSDFDLIQEADSQDQYSILAEGSSYVQYGPADEKGWEPHLGCPDKKLFEDSFYYKHQDDSHVTIIYAAKRENFNYPDTCKMMLIVSIIREMNLRGYEVQAHRDQSDYDGYFAYDLGCTINFVKK